MPIWVLPNSSPAGNMTAPRLHKRTAKAFLAQAAAQGSDLRIGGWPFGAAVPAVVVAGPVGVAPAVGLVMLFIVGIQVVQGKAVVAGDKVDRGVLPPVRRIQIRRSADAV